MAPTTQNAWIMTRQGRPTDALVFQTDWPVSAKLAKGEVLVKISAAALNPVGHKLMGWLPNFIAKRPLPAEYDIAGVVEDTNHSNFEKGDKVFGWIPIDITQSTKQGALQQYARVPAGILTLQPSNVTATEASGIGLAGETAWQALFDAGRFEAGQSVLINGGSSAVGAFAIQIAKAKGASRIVAVSSGKNEEFVRSLGADEFVDYTKRPVYEHFAKMSSPKFDLILDAIGLQDSLFYRNSPAYLAPGGTFVSVAPLTGLRPFVRTFKIIFSIVWPAWLGGVPRTYRAAICKHKPSDLQQIAELVEDGTVKPLIDSVYEFEDVLKAYERIMTNRATGKVVVKVDLST